jgi:uncharacterized protein (DUF1800 family)
MQSLWHIRPWQSAVLGASVLIASAFSGVALGRNRHQASAVPMLMDEQKRAIHALNRLTFGPRPGDLQRITKIGIDNWIDLQLHPNKIDDSALEARLADFRTLRMSTQQIVENFPPEQLIKQVADGKATMPQDAMERVVYEAQLQRYENKLERREEKKTASKAPSGPPVGDNGTKESATDAPVGLDASEMRRREDRRAMNVKAQELLDMPIDERMKAILQMSPEDQLILSNISKGPGSDALLDGMNAQQKEMMMALRNPEQVVVDELTQAKLLRAIYSERQLDEVLTDFWMNHFNVFINKGADRYLLTSYERDAIRPHALGQFEDLLVATAKSPAMMFYLDNWLSVGPDSDIALGVAAHADRRAGNHRNNNSPARPRKKGKPASGLNENYGRELMELHTLSVNGGYTQKDVTEVAKVFTGWTIERPAKGGDFRFEPRMHEPGDKIVLGRRIKSNGQKEGLEVLHLLARNPQTAHFISQKLALRFVSDDPPPALVDRMAHVFLKKNGDIREVLRAMFKSPEFWASNAYRAKVKTPLEFVVSAVRASGAEVTDARPLVGALNNMGMAPYGMMPPTGYPMKADAWVNSSALLTRMNFALNLASGKVRGVKVNGPSLNLHPVNLNQMDPRLTLARLEDSLLAGDISKQTHDTISKQLDDPAISQRRLDDPKRPPNEAAITGLILGSPEFQRR